MKNRIYCESIECSFCNRFVSLDVNLWNGLGKLVTTSIFDYTKKECNSFSIRHHHWASPSNCILIRQVNLFTKQIIYIKKKLFNTFAHLFVTATYSTLIRAFIQFTTHTILWYYEKKKRKESIPSELWIQLKIYLDTNRNTPSITYSRMRIITFFVVFDCLLQLSVE